MVMATLSLCLDAAIALSKSSSRPLPVECLWLSWINTGTTRVSLPPRMLWLRRKHPNFLYTVPSCISHLRYSRKALIFTSSEFLYDLEAVSSEIFKRTLKINDGDFFSRHEFLILHN